MFVWAPSPSTPLFLPLTFSLSHSSTTKKFKKFFYYFFKLKKIKKFFRTLYVFTRCIDQDSIKKKTT
jgi:hypothetical protein